MSGNSTEHKSLDFMTVAARTRRTAYFALAVSTIIAAVGLVTLFDMRRSARWIAHTHEVIDMLGRTVVDLRDANGGVNSYLIMGDSTFLPTHRTGLARLNTDLAWLRREVGDNPRQVRRLMLIDSLVAQKKKLWTEQLYVQRVFGVDSASKFVRNSPSFMLMQRLLRIVQGAASEERALLADRGNRLDRELWLAVLIIVVGFLCAVYLVSTTNIRLLRTLRARERAEDQAVQARQNAEAANLAKSDFLARMSHELRTPLNSVIGFANVMRKNKGGHLTEGDLTYLDRIQVNGRHLLSLINQILDLSKIEAGRVELIIEAVDVAALAHDVVAQFEPMARERGLVLQVEVAGGLKEHVFTDGEKLRQILINLIGNAMKFTQEGGVTVVIHAKRGALSAIDVRDTGIGIPRDRLGAVFEAFEQAETSTTRRFGGTGLGLSISRSLAQLMGLELTVDSELGAGTTFTLLFPSRTQKFTPSRGMRTDEWRTATAIDTALLHDKLVLVIDDDADSRTLLGQYLEDVGCRVIAATNGEQGLRVANRFEPDVIVLDLRMPELDGWEVMRRLGADPALQHVPIIIVSIVATEHPEQFPAGVALLDKPCTREQLALALSAALKPASQTA